MKNLIISLLLLSILGKSQTTEYNGEWYGSKQKIKFESTCKLCFESCYISMMKIDSMNTIIVNDSCKGQVAFFNDKNLSVTDSLSTIKILFFFARKNHIELMEIYDKYYAAENVLSCVNPNGIINNKQRFDAAVKRYKKVYYKYNPPLKYKHITTTTKKK